MLRTGMISDFKSELGLVSQFVREVFPKVNCELDRWRTKVQGCPDEVLAGQAAASIAAKRFHAQGGSIYALYPGVSQPEFAGFVVALQTISDYLDNLCDRAGVQDEAAFRQLHLAMEDALLPGKPQADYYRYYPHADDGGYLASLVRECREHVRRLPAFELVQEDVVALARLYSELQTYKHLPLDVREHHMVSWARPYLAQYPGLSCWEFAAATGSTLGIFVLCAVASNPDLSAEEAGQIRRTYFPWICGLHILLDYFIDQQEDRDGGDLNFIFYYPDRVNCGQRLTWFLEQAEMEIAKLRYPLFHRTVLDGLLALYLSDPKTASGEIRRTSKALLRAGGGTTRLLHMVCCLLRWRKTI